MKLFHVNYNAFVSGEALEVFVLAKDIADALDIVSSRGTVTGIFQHAKNVITRGK